MISPNNRVGRDKLGSVFFSHSHEMHQCVANAEGHWLKEGGLGQLNRGKEPLEKDTLKPQYALTLPHFICTTRETLYWLHSLL